MIQVNYDKLYTRCILWSIEYFGDEVVRVQVASIASIAAGKRSKESLPNFESNLAMSLYVSKNNFV